MDTPCCTYLLGTAESLLVTHKYGTDYDRGDRTVSPSDTRGRATLKLNVESAVDRRESIVQLCKWACWLKASVIGAARALEMALADNPFSEARRVRWSMLVSLE